MRAKILSAIFTALMMTGCVASGVRVTEEQVTQFEKGKSTYSDVVGKLGQPTSMVLTSTGLRVVTYSYVEAAARPATFIPIVGPLVGGADARSNVVMFMFDRDGILANYSTSSSQTGTGFGGASGTVVTPVENQPRQSN